MKNLKQSAFLLLSIFLCQVCSAQKDTTKNKATNEKGEIVKVATFMQLIQECGLSYQMPQGFVETYVRENPDLHFDFAIKNKTEDFEVRYTIWPLKQALADYKKCKDDPKCHMVHPNVIYKGRVEANVLNMTGGVNWEIGSFDPGAVKNEFNADAGGSSFFEFNCDFGTGYKFGQMIFLHKDDIADVIITYMSNDRQKHPDFMRAPFHSLVFKK